MSINPSAQDARGWKAKNGARKTKRDKNTALSSIFLRSMSKKRDPGLIYWFVETNSQLLKGCLNTQNKLYYVFFFLFSSAGSILCTTRSDRGALQPLAHVRRTWESAPQSCGGTGLEGHLMPGSQSKSAITLQQRCTRTKHKRRLAREISERPSRVRTGLVPCLVLAQRIHYL